MSDCNVIAPFGPLIYTTDISEEFHQFLLDGLDDCRKAQDARNRLVVNIDKQRFAPYDPTKFTKFLDPHLINYLNEKHKRHNRIKDVCNDKQVEWDAYKSVVRYNLGRGPWVNFQQKGEFNPLHNHGGIVSAVLFIKIPHELDEERKNCNYTAKASGCLEFVHSNQHIVVKPREATLYLFPAYLQHAVYPYHSDVERISMSFNFDEVVIDDFPIPGPNDDPTFYGTDPTQDP